ncbi:pyroglutamyl-peptidase I [Paenibacillus sp. EC2-1]|uniref:pyroglutamyl-peptidase I n=1 Tax=Paenibacillus sp. EC2-1 TaxID=3388665 RepID=UPI003BEEE0CD
MKILISGFEPFGGSKMNPTEQLIQDIVHVSFEGVEIKTLLLPVYFDECADLILQEIQSFEPDAVIACGVAAGRTAITPERIAINIKDIAPDSPYPDNRGVRPQDEPIHPDHPDGLFTNLPIRKMVERLRDQGIPALISNSAGTYICNNTMYALLDHMRINQVPKLGGFIHFPASIEMATDKPSMPTMHQDTMLKGLQIIIQTTIDELMKDKIY